MWISLVLLLSTGSKLFAQQTQKVSPAGTKYLLYTPPGYNPAQSYPLLIVLHGQGGLGDNLNLLLNKDEIPSKLIHQNQWPSRYPFIVVSPQLKRDPSVPDPADQLWPPQMVDEVVEHVRSGYAVNPNKIYITGLSQGAHGSYDYTTAFPSKIAAAVYISGVPDSTKACLVKDIPVWVLHGTDDSLVPPVFAYGLARNLNACGGKFKPHLNMLYGRRHEGWNEVYNNTNGFNIFDWMLKFTKNDPANTPPYANAGGDLTVAIRQQPLHVRGEFFDSDGQVANIRWTKVSGPAITMSDTDSRFLKLTDLTTGEFEFELAVTDDNGAQTRDRIRITIIGSNNNSPAVTGLTLLDASGNVLAASLYDGYVINPTTMRKHEVNLRAQVSGSVRSVRYRISSNENARTSENSNDDFPLASPRWTLNEGEYLVCATPFTGAGATGSAGTSQCFKIVFSATATPPPPPVQEPPVEEPPVEEPPVEEPPVEEPPIEQPPAAPAVFYAMPGLDISQLASWSTNPTGIGTSPASFTANGQTFEVRGEAVLNNPLAIRGTGSVLRVISGGKLTLNASLQTPVNLQGQAMLSVATDHVPALGTLEPQSTVTFTSNVTIPAAVYGHLTLNGNGSLKNLQTGVTTVTGTLTIADGVRVEGSADGSSTLAVSGDIQILTLGSFEPAQPFSLVFNKQGTQAFIVNAIHVSLHAVAIRSGTTVDVNSGQNNTLLEVGSTTGGGLTVETGARLLLKKNDLFISGAGTLNALNQKGEIAFRQSALAITSSAGENSNLYVAPGSDTLRTLSVNLSGTGQLVLQQPLFISRSVTPFNGITQSNGYLNLVSTAASTASVSALEGTGRIAGNVVFQRFIPKGNQERYLGFPVQAVTVKNLQQFVTVKGRFIGASPGDPSLYYYDDLQARWVPYPQSDNDEQLIPGTGYRLTSLNANSNTKIVVSGPLLQGDFSFTLRPNPANDPSKGWNLIGNPYAATVGWMSTGWTLEAVSPAAYVYDDNYPGGRFLVWDGEVGDREFAGAISQGQGFFVRTTGNDPILTIHEGAKIDSVSQLWRTKRTQAHSGMMTVALKQHQLIDKTYLKFSKDGVNAFEQSDGVKRKNGYFSIYTLSDDSVSLAINHLGESFCDNAIRLVADAPPGQYSFVFDSLGVNGLAVNLLDRYTGEVVTVTQGSEHTFQIDTDPMSSSRNRFVIEMPSGTLDPVITVQENVLTSNIAAGNQWYFNGEEIKGATEQTLIAETSGEYTLVASSNGCTKASDPVAVTVTVTAVPESQTWDVEVYPNPASRFITIRLQAGTAGPLSYVVHNALGMTLLRGTWDNPLSNDHPIDVGGFSPGVYFLTIEADGWKHRIRFVIDSSHSR